MPFYITVPPFEGDHILKAAFFKKAEIIVTGKSLVCYDGTVVRICSGLFQNIGKVQRQNEAVVRYCNYKR